MFESAIKCQHFKKLLEFSTEVSPVFVKQLFPNFEDVYGDGSESDELEDGYEKVKVIFGSDYKMNPPNITISKDGIAVSGNATLKIMNPLNSEIVSAIIYTDFDFSGSIQMESGYNVTGIVNNLNLSVTDLRPLFDSSETVHSIKNKMKGVETMIFTAMNEYLNQGTLIPIPEYAKKDFKESSLKLFDSYLLVEANPDVHEYMDSLDQIVMASSEYINQLI